MSAPSGLLYGKLPGNRKWSLYYIETMAAMVHVREGSANPTRTKGRQLRTLIISPNDLVGEEKSRKKKRFKFFLQRLDGKYLFRCDSSGERQDWLIHLERMITRGQDASGDYCEADLGPLNDRSTQELEEHPWFWGWMSREDCERRLQTEGEVGNFVVRINAVGDYVMSFWRTDGIVHHKITHDGNLYSFESSTVPAEGSSLAGLLNVYMSQYSDKIKPFGGSLFMLHAENVHLKHQIHQQLASNAAHLVPTPPTKRNPYPPVDLKQDLLSGRNTDHQDGWRTLKTQLPPVPPTRLTDRPLPTPPLPHKQFSYEHTSVQRSASLQIINTQNQIRDPLHVNMRTRPLPPRHHPREPDKHHYANQNAMEQTQQDEPLLKHQQPGVRVPWDQMKQKRKQPHQQDHRQERRHEQWQQEQQQQQQWQLNQGNQQQSRGQQRREIHQQEQQQVQSGINTAEDHYENRAMIRLHAKITPR